MLYILILSVVLNVGQFINSQNKGHGAIQERIPIYYLKEMLACDSYDAFEVNKAIENGPLKVTEVVLNNKARTSDERPSSLDVYWIDADNSDEVELWELCTLMNPIPDGHKYINVFEEALEGSGYEHIIEVDADMNTIKRYLVRY